MSVAKNIEITTSSPSSFEDAIELGIRRALKSLKNIQGAWIKEQKIRIENNQATEYRVTMILTFILDDSDDVGSNNVGNEGSGGSQNKGKSGKGKK